MPNDWFRFKQFEIRQDRCAMKVSTDACIQGAWAARCFASLSSPGRSYRVLDIGAGTGLLSLMLAQELPGARIEAIELNMEAAGQAAANCQASPWSNRLRVNAIALNDFTNDDTVHPYDFIICNPPFFHQQLPSPEAARNDARHSTALDKESLARGIARLMSDEGTACIMYPAREWPNWLKAAADEGLYPLKLLNIQARRELPANRILGLFGKKAPAFCTDGLLTIYDQPGAYTLPFTVLLRPFYLHL